MARHAACTDCEMVFFARLHKIQLNASPFDMIIHVCKIIASQLTSALVLLDSVLFILSIELLYSVRPQAPLLFVVSSPCFIRCPLFFNGFDLKVIRRLFLHCESKGNLKLFIQPIFCLLWSRSTDSRDKWIAFLICGASFRGLPLLGLGLA